MLDSIVPPIEKITPKTKQRLQIHQSGLEMLSKCGIQFEFRYLRGVKRRPNAFLICGTATDRAVSTDLDHKIETGELAAESDLLDVARDVVENYPEKELIELEDEESGKSVADVLDSTKDKAVRLVKAHHAEIAPIIRPVATAKKFSISMDEFLRSRAKELRRRMESSPKSLANVLNLQARYLNVAARNGLDFVGEFDIVEKYKTNKCPDDGLGNGQDIQERSIIRDTKTSKKSPNQSTADESHQLGAYAVAHHVLYNRLPDAVKLDYVIDLKGGVKTMTLNSHRDMEDVNAYLNRLVAGVIQMQSGNFVPAPDTAWWCDPKWCAYHAHCEYVKRREISVPNLVQISGADGHE